MATNAHHSSVDQYSTRTTKHALEFFISTSRSNFVTKRPLRLTRSASLCATKSQPASNSLCTIVPSLHTPPLVRINRRETENILLFSSLSLCVMIIDQTIQKYFCCERSCGKLIFSWCVCLQLVLKTAARHAKRFM